MVQIAGKYQHVSNNNYEEFIKSLGQQDRASDAVKSSPLLEIQKLNDNPEQWKVTVTVSGKTLITTFFLNQLYDEVLPSLPDLTVKVGFYASALFVPPFVKESRQSINALLVEFK